MTAAYRILHKPVITEKSMAARESTRTICFRVASDASKPEIRAAVEDVFKELRGKITSIRTAGFQGKERRRGRTVGRRPDWKKAYIRVAADAKLPQFGEMA